MITNWCNSSWWVTIGNPRAHSAGLIEFESFLMESTYPFSLRFQNPLVFTFRSGKTVDDACIRWGSLCVMLGAYPVQCSASNVSGKLLPVGHNLHQTNQPHNSKFEPWLFKVESLAWFLSFGTRKTFNLETKPRHFRFSGCLSSDELSNSLSSIYEKYRTIWRLSKSVLRLVRALEIV